MITLAQDLVKRMAALRGKISYTNDGRREDTLRYMAGDCSSIINAILRQMGQKPVGTRSYNIAENNHLQTVATGTRVAGSSLAELVAKLRPGDLVCCGWSTGYYHPSGISHVDVYAGQGMIWGHGGPGNGPTRQTLGSRLKGTRVFIIKRIPELQAPAKTVAAMAQEVLAGKHGNGHANRQRSLGVDAATYAKVRAEVNKQAAAKGSISVKTVAAMAQEVLAGKHGNGHANRQRSLGIDAATYAKVRAEVNRRA